MTATADEVPVRILLACVLILAPGIEPLSQAEQTRAPRRVLAADDSTHRLGIVGADGVLEWEVQVGAIHDASVLPNGNILFQQGWTRIVEMTKDKRMVWEYDAATMNGNAGKRVEVHAFQRVENGLTMIAESGPARIIEVDRQGKIQHEIKLKANHPSTHSDTRLARKIASGNYLVAHESDGFVREYDKAGKIVWEYWAPYSGQVRQADGTLPQPVGSNTYAVFRAAKIPPQHPALAGRDHFLRRHQQHPRCWPLRSMRARAHALI